MGGTSLVMVLANRRTNRSACLEQSSMEKVSLKKQQLSLGLIVLEEKSFTHTYMPQSDDIKSAD